MTDVDLLVIFNHRHESVLDPVLEYNSRFSDNVVVAAPFAGPGIVQYSSGVFLAQGAIVEYLASGRWRNEYTLVVHDDFVLNPATRLPDLLPGDDREILRMYRTKLMAGPMTPTWYWQFRVMVNWFTPRSNPYGTGVNSPRELLAESLLYQQNTQSIDAMGTSRLTFAVPPEEITATLAAWIDTHFPGREEFDLGLPLFQGNADYFLFPNRLAPLIDDFLRRTIESGVISEVAVPTLANWLGLPLEVDAPRQVLRTGPQWFTDVTSVADIHALFERQPELLSIHPIKFSRFTQSD